MINWSRLLNLDLRKSTKYKISRRQFLKSPVIAIFMGSYLTPHFKIDEMKCKGTGICEMDQVFMELLERIRKEYGKPMIVSSGFRHPDYNEIVSKKTGRTGPHTFGQACDILVSGNDAMVLVQLAKEMGMTGIGIKQHGPHNQRFIHLDNLDNSTHPRPTIWSYPA
jgi:zinc D-Ala-D-Ala carboxypeptidase